MTEARQARKLTRELMIREEFEKWLERIAEEWDITYRMAKEYIEDYFKEEGK